MWHVENAHRWNVVHVITTITKKVKRETSTMADLLGFNAGSAIYNLCDLR